MPDGLSLVRKEDISIGHLDRGRATYCRSGKKPTTKLAQFDDGGATLALAIADHPANQRLGIGLVNQVLLLPTSELIGGLPVDRPCGRCYVTG